MAPILILELIFSTAVLCQLSGPEEPILHFICKLERTISLLEHNKNVCVCNLIRMIYEQLLYIGSVKLTKANAHVFLFSFWGNTSEKPEPEPELLINVYSYKIL